MKHKLIELLRTRGRITLCALLLTLGAADISHAQQSLVMSGFPGAIGTNIKKSFFETYDRANAIR